MRIAIITARGGSKRIPGKNIRIFCGKPIIAYSIIAAINSNLFDEVMVSTDSHEIAEIAKTYGASVPFFRSKENSNDYATTNDVLREVLYEYKLRGKQFNIMCCIYPTAPFITPEKLCESMKIIEESDQLALMPVVKYSYPPQRAFSISDGVLVSCCPEYIESRSQELEPIYHDCGQYYIHKIDSNNNFLTDQFVPYIVSELEVQDIDNLTDWEIAEMKYRLMKQRMVKNV